MSCFLFALRITGVGFQELRAFGIRLLLGLGIRELLGADTLHLFLVGSYAVRVAW
jgi:hypothetical protein